MRRPFDCVDTSLTGNQSTISWSGDGGLGGASEGLTQPAGCSCPRLCCFLGPSGAAVAAAVAGTTAAATVAPPAAVTAAVAGATAAVTAVPPAADAVAVAGATAAATAVLPAAVEYTCDFVNSRISKSF